MTYRVAVGAWPEPMTVVGIMARFTEIHKHSGACKGDTGNTVHRGAKEVGIIGLLYSMGLVAIETGEHEIGRQVLAGAACAVKGVRWSQNLRRIVGVAIGRPVLVGCPVDGNIGSNNINMAIQTECVVIRSGGTLNFW